MSRAINRQPAAVTRSLNDRLVIDILLASGPKDRPALAALTGLSRPSIADLISRLIADGVVEEVGEAQITKRGPNAMLYGLSAGLGAVAGVEVQPDHAQATIADVNGTVLGSAVVAARGSEEPHHLVRRVLRQACKPSGLDSTSLKGVVVGTPGIVDAGGHITFVWGHPEWVGGQRQTMQDLLGVPISFENDTKLAAVAEKRLGVAGDVESFVLFRCGESVSAATMLGSTLVRGAHGAAGEIGYLPRLDLDPTAGNHNEGYSTIVGYAGLTQVLERLGSVGLSPVLAIAPGILEPNTYPVFVREVAHRLTAGIVSLCAAIDPELVVLCGDLAVAGGEPLADAIRTEIAETSPFRPRLAVSSLGADAVVQGALASALATARNDIYSDPSIHLPGMPGISLSE